MKFVQLFHKNLTIIAEEKLLARTHVEEDNCVVVAVAVEAVVVVVVAAAAVSDNCCNIAVEVDNWD
jgi:hypothetical protein